ncbi:thiamine biosynthesis lipoprotein [Sagittula marina]|uniref:FAD:protein FMN transferase n=2 Tax=Sagittula marina TaxID=943940 RepID=A0A7W6DRQ9_9RHOB|nr:FAD:protein FMN transferase [Sagittula marina]MBB3987594.1 thiamine biosynthesis lipoprotein [Sagittula marina]
MMKRRRFLCLTAAFATAPALAHAGTWRGRALGAEASVTLTGPRSAVDRALTALPKRLEQIEAAFSLYRADSALVQLNTRGRLRPSSDFHALMTLAAQAHDLTDGLFDPTVQPLWHALARGTDIEAARRLIGFDRVRIAPDVITLGRGQALTLNGIAQGYATDLIKDDLARQGFTKALVDMGEAAALGGPFRLTLNDPQHGALGHVTLENAARATSSPGALRLGAEAHILGPRGQEPLWSTVSLEGPSATLADALSTAAVFMDHPALRQLKIRAGLSSITTIDADGALRTL